VGNTKKIVRRPVHGKPLTQSTAGIKHKVENKHQYQEYLDELKGLREELGVNLKEDLYPENSDSPYFNP
jgi:Cytochrome c oxidase subunit Va